MENIIFTAIEVHEDPLVSFYQSLFCDSLTSQSVSKEYTFCSYCIKRLLLPDP